MGRRNKSRQIRRRARFGDEPFVGEIVALRASQNDPYAIKLLRKQKAKARKTGLKRMSFTPFKFV